MRLTMQQLLEVLHTQGDNDTADAVQERLPDEIDTDRDADALSAVGLHPTQLMAKLAGSSFGTTLSP